MSPTAGTDSTRAHESDRRSDLQSTERAGGRPVDRNAHGVPAGGLPLRHSADPE